MRMKVLLVLTLLAMSVVAPSSAETKTTRTVRFNQFTRGEYCLHMREIFSDPTNEKPLDHCIQDNNKAYAGVGAGAGPVCLNEKALACLAKYGQLVAGGWPYFHGEKLAYGILPNTHLIAAVRTSTYVTPFSTMDQSFFARTNVAGTFAYTWMGSVGVCLEVFDWGQPEGGRLYINRTRVGYDCLKPGEPIRPLEVTGTAFAGRLMWIVVTLYSSASDGVSYFSVIDVVHDIS